MFRQRSLAGNSRLHPRTYPGSCNFLGTPERFPCCHPYYESRQSLRPPNPSWGAHVPWPLHERPLALRRDQGTRLPYCVPSAPKKRSEKSRQSAERTAACHNLHQHNQPCTSRCRPSIRHGPSSLLGRLLSLLQQPFGRLMMLRASRLPLAYASCFLRPATPPSSAAVRAVPARQTRLLSTVVPAAGLHHLPLQQLALLLHLGSTALPHLAVAALHLAVAALHLQQLPKLVRSGVQAELQQTSFLQLPKAAPPSRWVQCNQLRIYTCRWRGIGHGRCISVGRHVLPQALEGRAPRSSSAALSSRSRTRSGQSVSTHRGDRSQLRKPAAACSRAQ